MQMTKLIKINSGWAVLQFCSAISEEVRLATGLGESHYVWLLAKQKIRTHRIKETHQWIEELNLLQSLIKFCKIAGFLKIIFHNT